MEEGIAWHWGQKKLLRPPITDLTIIEGEHKLEYRWRSGQTLKRTVRVTSQENQRFFEASPERSEGIGQ